MSEMVVRVARAIGHDSECIMSLAEEERLDCDCDLGKRVRAAIAAMREPTEAILDAGMHGMDGRTLVARWQSMIDAALSDSPPRPSSSRTS